MTDEHKTDNPVTAPEEKEQESKVLTQDEVNRIIAERLERERKKYADYEDLRKKAETLEAEKRQREEKELLEQKKYEELLKQREEELQRLKSVAEKYEQWQKQEQERIEKEMESLTETQKAIVNALPLEQRLQAINEFKSSTAAKPGITPMKGGKVDGFEVRPKSQEEVDKLFEAWRKGLLK
jgi:DNA repair exonuclease SbcCD ATPase subunit